MRPRHCTKPEIVERVSVRQAFILISFFLFFFFLAQGGLEYSFLFVKTPTSNKTDIGKNKRIF
uniref:Uncharacterized protein n=1 Tax=Anguilla anguilla TaxID=7936 RepID=A0A0E9WCW7_ANGAN